MTFNVIIELSGLTPAERHSWFGDEWNIGGFNNDFLVDYHYDEATCIEVLIMEEAAGYSEADIRAGIQEETAAAIAAMREERAEKGLGSFQFDTTFHDTLSPKEVK